MEKESKVQVLIKPNWHQNISQILGNIIGEYGYVTDRGTIELLGSIHEDPEIQEESIETKNSGPTVLLSAVGGLGVC